MTVNSNLYAPPASANTEDDEFNNSVTSLANWTDFGDLSGPAIDITAGFAGTTARRDINTPKRSWLRIQAPNDAVNLYGMHKLFAGAGALADGIYWMRAAVAWRFGGLTAQDSNIGLYLSSSAASLPDHANEGPRIFLSETDTNVMQGEFDVLNGGTPVGPANTGDLDQVGNHFEYVLILKDGDVYSGFIGSGPGNWVHLNTFTYTGGQTIDRVFIAAQNASIASPGNMIVGVDFFRYNSTKDLP